MALKASAEDRSGEDVVCFQNQCSDPLVNYALACRPFREAYDMSREEVRLKSRVSLYSPHTLANDTGDSHSEFGRGFVLVVGTWISEAGKRIIC